jgi:hypothetical protein
MRSCVNCGHALGPDDAFCTGCGAGQSTPAGQAGPGTGFRPANAGPEGPPIAPVAAGLAAAAGSTVARGAPVRPAGGAGTAGPANGPAGQAGPTVQAPQPPATMRVGAPPAAAPAAAQAAETIEQKYLRQTRNATVFIAIIVGVFTAISLIGVIWTATTIARLDSQLNGTFSGVTNGNCLSQGGSNPNC